MTVREELYNLLSIVYPAYLTGTYPIDEEYPASFYTFFNQRTDLVLLDNDEKESIYIYTINFYTNNPEIIDTEIKEKRKLLKDNGYAVSGPYDVRSDEKSHIGKGFICRITKYE